MGNCVWFVVVLAIACPFAIHCGNRNDRRQERLVLEQPEQDLDQVVAALKIEVLAMKAEMDILKQQVNLLSSRPIAGTYTRWGRTVCPENSTDLVYKGFAAGNWYSKAGGAADFLCLPTEPKWGVYDDSNQNYAVPIYGAEYQFADSFSDGGAHFFGQNLHQHDAPCAVCHAFGSTTLMIPGRNLCYPGWKLEYHGYLASAKDGDASATNYICLDVQAETEFGDISNDNGKLINFVEAACGTLKCPPYVQNRELTCVVCSK